MSTGVCGIIYTNFHEENEEMELAFCFERIANNLKIGTKLGGNITKYVFDKYIGERGRKALFFELTDTPIDIHAETLFAPNSYKNSEPLSNRMSRVQDLFETLLSIRNVITITLEVNYLFADGTERETTINAKAFCEVMVQMFHQNEGFPPVARFKITK